MENKIKTIYKRLCFTSVFCGVLEKPLFRAFFAYCESEEEYERNKAYARFVSEIYAFGGSLTALVEKEISEDENVYVKSFARGEKTSPCIERAAKNELCTFSDFASLKAEDFAVDMGLSQEKIPDFNSMNADMGALYFKRLQNIDKYGYGIFSAYGMFRLSEEKAIEPIVSFDKIGLDRFIGYEEERGKVIENTKAFLSGRSAANALLYGDAGTGKSSTVKAVANAFFGEGLRLIEIRKNQLSLLPFVMGKISGNPLKFIIFIDDLSFNKNDDDFAMLKAALEGSASAKAENAVIYATSNRRHIVKERFSDREEDDVHRNDTLQETLSLSERFGLRVQFSKPDKKLYLEIVESLARKRGIRISFEELAIEAEAFALKKGNRSARCAEQFIESLL